VGDSETCWDVIDNVLNIQLSEIQASFGRSRTVLEHKYKGKFLYFEFEGCVSGSALIFIFEEAKHSKTTGVVKINCRCVIKTSYGLPCVCTLAMKIQKKIAYSIG